MTTNDPDSDAVDETSSEAIAPDHVQRDIASMLRHAAQSDHGPEARMPAGVESSILAALSAEGLERARTGDKVASPVARTGGTPTTMIPLPGGARSGNPSHRNESASAFVLPPEPGTAETSRHDSETASHPAGHAPAGSAPVRSLEAHRRGKHRVSRVALSLGAAAAVALGAFGIWQGTNGGSGNQPTSAAASDGAARPDVRVTNSETAYTSSSFTEQAEELSTQKQPAITSSAEARQQGLGELATAQGLETCVTAIDSVLKGHPDKIYADFGTYEGQPSVIVVVVKDGKKTAWAVNRTCTNESDARTSPHTLTT